MIPERIACLDCDLLVSISDLDEGERAHCPRCGFLIAARTRDGLRRPLAFALASAMLLAVTNAFPFLALESQGLENVMTLPGTAVELFRDGYAALAVLVGGVTVVIPGVMIFVLVGLLTTLVRGQSRPWLVGAGRLVFGLSSWSMVEVFLIGVIVSLVKISHMASVVLGVAFWAYVGFAVCFTAALSSLDRREVWDEIERCAS